MQKTYLGENPDGTAHYGYVTDKPVLLTGPVSGPVELPDGTVYDVTEPVIELEDEAHAGLLSHLIGVRHELRGHPAHLDPDEPFRHECGPECGELRREGTA